MIVWGVRYVVYRSLTAYHTSTAHCFLFFFFFYLNFQCNFTDMYKRRLVFSIHILYQTHTNKAKYYVMLCFLLAECKCCFSPPVFAMCGISIEYLVLYLLHYVLFSFNACGIRTPYVHRYHIKIFAAVNRTECAKKNLIFVFVLILLFHCYIRFIFQLLLFVRF